MKNERAIPEKQEFHFCLEHVPSHDCEGSFFCSSGFFLNAWLEHPTCCNTFHLQSPLFDDCKLLCKHFLV